MGMILDDNDKNIHIECRSESVAIFTDYGDESIEIDFDQFKELKILIEKAYEYLTEQGRIKNE